MIITTVRIGVIIGGLLEGNPPMLAYHKIATRPDGKRKLFSQIDPKRPDGKVISSPDLRMRGVMQNCGTDWETSVAGAALLLITRPADHLVWE